MATVTYSSISFLDTHNKKVNCRIEGVTDGAALATLAGHMQSISNASWQSYRIETTNSSKRTPLTGERSSCSVKAVFVFTDADLHIYKMSVPAPLLSIIEQTAKGETIKNATGVDMATKLGTATGRTLAFKSGRILQKQGKHVNS